MLKKIPKGGALQTCGLITYADLPARHIQEFISQKRNHPNPFATGSSCHQVKRG